MNSLAIAKSGRFIVAGVGQVQFIFFRLIISIFSKYGCPLNKCISITFIIFLKILIIGWILFGYQEPRLGRWGRLAGVVNGVSLHPLKLH